MYKSILIPVDLSHPDKGLKMIEAAKHLAEDDTEVLFLTVMEDVPVYIAAELPKDLQEKARKDVEAEMLKIAQSSGLKATAAIRSGAPAQEILAAAREHGCDLVLVASHKPGIQDIFLGSTAQRVVRRATCSVMVIR